MLSLDQFAHHLRHIYLDPFHANACERLPFHANANEYAWLHEYAWMHDASVTVMTNCCGVVGIHQVHNPSSGHNHYFYLKWVVVMNSWIALMIGEELESTQHACEHTLLLQCVSHYLHILSKQRLLLEMDSSWLESL